MQAAGWHMQAWFNKYDNFDAYLLHNYRLEKSSANVADFGLTRDVYVEDYYKMQGDTPLPVKWLAPEALFDREFSVKADVASNYPATLVLCVEV